MAWTSCFANLPNAWLRTTSLPSGPGLPGTGALIIRIVGSSPGIETPIGPVPVAVPGRQEVPVPVAVHLDGPRASQALGIVAAVILVDHQDRKSTRLNSSHSQISYAVFCLKKKNKKYQKNIHCLL